MIFLILSHTFNLIYITGSSGKTIPTPFSSYYPPTDIQSPTTPWPTWLPQTYYPTMVMDPTTKPSPNPSTRTPTSPCTDSTPEWVGAHAGRGWEWYELNDEPGCPFWQICVKGKWFLQVIIAATAKWTKCFSFRPHKVATITVE